MKKYLDQLQKYLQMLLKLINRYSFIIFLIIFASLAGYLVTRIGYLSSLEPSQIQIDQKLENVKRPTTDTESILKLKELEGRNISIESLFDNGRTNPFED